MQALEHRVNALPTVAQVEAHVKEQMDLYMGTIKALITSTGMPHEPNNFRTKDARDHVPKPWSGDKDSISFTEVISSVKNWADALHDKGVEMLELVEVSKVPIEEDKLDVSKHPDIRKFSKLLFTQLSDKLTGEPIKFVNKEARGHGLAAWRELVNWYDPRANVDKAAAYAKIVSPSRRAKDTKQTIELMNVWEQMVANYEVRHGVIDDVGKITGLKQILPESLIDNHFRGKIYEKFQSFRQDVTNFLNDRTKAKEDNRMDIDALIAQLQPHQPDHQENCELPTTLETNEDFDKILALVWNKGKGKGKYGPQKGAWRNDPQDQNQSSYQSFGNGGKGSWGDWGKNWGTDWGKGKGSWGSFGKGPQYPGGNDFGKGKGKKGKADGGKGGKGKNPDVVCYGCGGKGHIAKNCPSRVNSFVEDTPDAHEENGDEEGCWCFVEAESEDISACEAHESIEDCRCDFTEVLSKKGKKEIKREKVDVMMIQETRGKWVRIEAGVDSCAAVNVCPTHMFPQVPVGNDGVVIREMLFGSEWRRY